MTTEQMNAKYQEYMTFMYSPENSHKCAECPENIGAVAWPETKLPCGQFRCWVDCHCQEGGD